MEGKLELREGESVCAATCNAQVHLQKEIVFDEDLVMHLQETATRRRKGSFDVTLTRGPGGGLSARATGACASAMRASSHQQNELSPRH
jgi:hypothetical protein